MNLKSKAFQQVILIEKSCIENIKKNYYIPNWKLQLLDI